MLESGKLTVFESLNPVATREQCERRLREVIKTPEDFTRICRRFSAAPFGNMSPSSPDYVEKQIAHLVQQAVNYGKLDELGLDLGIESTAEQERIATTRALELSEEAVRIAKESRTTAHKSIMESGSALRKSKLAIFCAAAVGIGGIIAFLNDLFDLTEKLKRIFSH